MVCFCFRQAKNRKLICQLNRKERTSTTTFVLILEGTTLLFVFVFYFESEQNSLHGFSNRSRCAFKILLELHNIIVLKIAGAEPFPSKYYTVQHQHH
jgi:hypothetical protein